MASAHGSDDEVISGINITPLVDVVLVLLIIFLITAPAIYQSAIKVDLPKAKTGEEAQKSALQFTVTKEGKVLWDKETVDWKTIASRLKGKSFSNEVALISADRATAHGIVIQLIDTLRQEGLTRFSLNVDNSR